MRQPLLCIECLKKSKPNRSMEAVTVIDGNALCQRHLDVHLKLWFAIKSKSKTPP